MELSAPTQFWARLRKLFFWFHLSAGLTAGLFLLNLAVSGMVLAFDSQIIDWAEKDLRFVSPAGEKTTRLTLDELAARARAANPGHPISAVALKADPRASVLFQFGREGDALFVDPYTGAVLGRDSRARRFLHKVEEWHRWLGKKEIGKPVTGAAALSLCFMAFSGLYLWWPRKWNGTSLHSSALYNPRLKGKARDWNWHNVAGIWCLLLILATASTGALMSYDWANRLLYRLARSEPPAAAPVAAPAAKVASAAPSLDRFFGSAVARQPVWKSVLLRFPQKPEGAYTAIVFIPNAWHPYRRSQLTWDASSSEPGQWEPYDQQSLGWRLRSWVKPIHTGEWGGWPTQMLVFLSAAGIVLLIWTGAALAWRRCAAFRARRSF